MTTTGPNKGEWNADFLLRSVKRNPASDLQSQQQDDSIRDKKMIKSLIKDQIFGHKTKRCGKISICFTRNSCWYFRSFDLSENLGAT